MRPARSTWLVVAVPGVAALSMLAVMLFGLVQTRRSADLLLHGEADLWLQRVGNRLRDLHELPTPERLKQWVDSEGQAGLSYVALVRLDGSVLVESGATPPGLANAVALRPGAVLRLKDSAWVHSAPLPGRPPPGEAPLPPDARGPPPFGPGGTTSFFLVFEPRLEGQLDFAARANVIAGLVGALGLLALGAFAFRLMRGRDEMVRRLEHERRLASLGTMSGVVAHELRNPLATLKGHAQLLQEQLAQTPQKPRADRVVDAAWRMERLITSLLELARTGALNRDEVVPADVVRLALTPFEAQRVKLDVNAAPARWSLDAVRFQQVITNLVDNALQASPVEAVVDVRVTQEAEQLVVEVRDRGPGVPPEERERIFEPFVTTRTTGIGLGLAIARQVVALHGGELTVREAVGGGACFRATVPVAS